MSSRTDLPGRTSTVSVASSIRQFTHSSSVRRFWPRVLASAALAALALPLVNHVSQPAPVALAAPFALSSAVGGVAGDVGLSDAAVAEASAADVSGTVLAGAPTKTTKTKTTKTKATKTNRALSDSTTVTAESYSSTGNSAAAIAYSRVGSDYVYGGAGPWAFDCSGLVVYTYRRLGIYLPHNAAAQFDSNYGRLIWRMDQLQPGDALFFRNTAGWGITHAAIYVGNGMMATANSPSTGVVYQNIHTSYWIRHWAGAMRPYQQ